jgi:hypothetical protein
MRPHRTHRFPRRAACGLCGRALNLPSGFWFDTEQSLGLVHPDCFSYELERGPVGRGSWLEHTCGDANCVNPAHLVLHPAGAAHE